MDLTELTAMRNIIKKIESFPPPAQNRIVNFLRDYFEEKKAAGKPDVTSTPIASETSGFQEDYFDERFAPSRDDFGMVND